MHARHPEIRQSQSLKFSNFSILKSECTIIIFRACRNSGQLRIQDFLKGNKKGGGGGVVSTRREGKRTWA